MRPFEASSGERFRVERRIVVGWRPRLRGRTLGVGDLTSPDDFGADIVNAICAVIASVIFLLVAIPLLLFVAEVALVVALVVPLSVLALAFGVKQHGVALVRITDDRVVEERRVRGVLGSWRAARELRAAALGGAYALDTKRRVPAAKPRTPWSG